MLACKRLQILLIGAELLGLGHLRFVGDAHLRKEQLSELSARIDIYLTLTRHLTNLLLYGVELLRQCGRIGAQSLTIDADSLPLHIYQYIYHRLLNGAIERQQRRFLLDKRQQHIVELQCNICVLGSILRDTLHAYHIHRELLCSPADKRLYLYWRVVEISLCHGVHSVSRLGIEQVVQQHSIPLHTLNLYAQRTKEQDIELHILSHLGNALILENRSQNRGILRLNIVARSHISVVSKRDIPRLMFTNSE